MKIQHKHSVRKSLLHTLGLFILIIAINGCDSGVSPEEPDYTECVGGLADGYPCSNVGLYAVLSPDELLSEMADDITPRLNDIWGWIDPVTHKEYALVGLSDGVAFVDVTIPFAPVVVAKLIESNAAPLSHGTQLQHDEEDGFKEASIWRDMKVYQNTMYVVSEQEDFGLQVFDLTRLRQIGSKPAMMTEDYVYSEFGNAHNLAINEETGYAYVVGSTSGETCAERGGLHMISLANPLQPEFAGCYYEEEAGGISSNGYIHDTQCVVYRGPDTFYFGREVCFSSSELTFTITDVTHKHNPRTVFNSSYENNWYAHQGWLTEDHRYFFLNDELDERETGNNTRTYVWDVQDLENAEMIGYYEHATRAIDHNLYIYNDIMYQANYTAGLRVLDVSNPLPDAVREIGFFDTTPNNDSVEFAGLWSVYPWLSGNTVIVSDIHNGLFVLRVER